MQRMVVGMAGRVEEGRGKREEGRGKREEGRGKREEGRGARDGRTMGWQLCGGACWAGFCGIESSRVR
jgi:hypothetical protein